MRPLLVAALLLLSSLAQAANHSNVVFGPSETGVLTAQLTGSPQAVVRVSEYKALTFYIEYTRGTATSVSMSCNAGPSTLVYGTVAVATPQSTGAISMSPATWTWTVSSSGVLRAIVAPLNDRFVRCTFTAAGANASDRISVHALTGSAP